MVRARVCLGCGAGYGRNGQHGRPVHSMEYGVEGSGAPGEGMVSTGTPRETASHIVSLPLEQMTPVHFENSSWQS